MHEVYMCRYRDLTPSRELPDTYNNDETVRYFFTNGILLNITLISVPFQKSKNAG